GKNPRQWCDCHELVITLSSGDHGGALGCLSVKNQKKRIAYGVMGYGRGHAMRTMSVLPALMAEHEVTIFAGGDAYEVLAPRFPTVRIPTIGYQYGASGTHSLTRTVSRNFGPMRELLFGGPSMTELAREFRERGIDVVISDSES